DHDRVVHGAVLPQRLHDAGHRRRLEPDGDVDADDAGALLVDDGVDGDRRLAGLPVADDQLPLAPADGDHAVDGLDAGHHRFLDRLALGDARRPALDRHEMRRVDRALAVDRLGQGVDHPADEALAGRYRQHPARPLDRLAFADVEVVAEDDDADRVLLEVEGEAERPVLELDHLRGHRLLEAVDPGDAVADLEDGPHLVDVEVDVERLDLLADDGADLVGPDLRHGDPVPVVALRY